PRRRSSRRSTRPGAPGARPPPDGSPPPPSPARADPPSPAWPNPGTSAGNRSRPRPSRPSRAGSGDPSSSEAWTGRSGSAGGRPRNSAARHRSPRSSWLAGSPDLRPGEPPRRSETPPLLPHLISVQGNVDELRPGRAAGGVPRPGEMRERQSPQRGYVDLSGRLPRPTSRITDRPTPGRSGDQLQSLVVRVRELVRVNVIQQTRAGRLHVIGGQQLDPDPLPLQQRQQAQHRARGVRHHLDDVPSLLELLHQLRHP